jgi:hypothetical protein
MSSFFEGKTQKKEEIMQKNIVIVAKKQQK